MTPSDVKPLQASPESAHDTADVLSAVVDSATAVARAELRLLKAEAKAWLTRVGVGLLLLWLSMLLLQVFVLVLSLTPVVAREHGWAIWGLMLLLAVVPLLGAVGFGLRELSRLKELGHGNNTHRDQ